MTRLVKTSINLQQNKNNLIENEVPKLSKTKGKLGDIKEKEILYYMRLTLRNNQNSIGDKQVGRRVAQS